MNLPNAERAQVGRSKITEYLLCAAHPDGAGKAEFFNQFGFRSEEWDILAEALRRHGASHPVAKVVDSAFGTRYAVEGSIESPDRRNPLVRTVWVLEKGSTAPRLITAYPLEDGA